MARRLLTALIGITVVTAGCVAFFGSRGARDVERRARSAASNATRSSW